MSKNSILILATKAPYGKVYNAEAFRAAIGLAACEMEVSLVLFGDAVLAAVKDQDPSQIGMKPLDQAYESLANLEVKLFAHQNSIKSRNLKNPDLIKLEIIDDSKLKELLQTNKHIMTF